MPFESSGVAVGVKHGYIALKLIAKGFAAKAERPRLVRGWANAIVVGGIWLDSFGVRKGEWEIADYDYVCGQLNSGSDHLVCSTHTTSKAYGDLAKYIWWENAEKFGVPNPQDSQIIPLLDCSPFGEAPVVVDKSMSVQIPVKKRKNSIPFDKLKLYDEYTMPKGSFSRSMKVFALQTFQPSSPACLYHQFFCQEPQDSGEHAKGDAPVHAEERLQFPPFIDEDIAEQGLACYFVGCAYKSTSWGRLMEHVRAKYKSNMKSLKGTYMHKKATEELISVQRAKRALQKDANKLADAVVADKKKQKPIA